MHNWGRETQQAELYKITWHIAKDLCSSVDKLNNRSSIRQSMSSSAILREAQNE